MYIPPHFAETDLPTLHDFIERNSFGVLISSLDGSPFATHLPFLLERASGSRGTLVGHMARANPQWREFAGRTVMTIFSGPHAYISPTWYESANVVPTWNYVAVHAYGKAEIVEDPAPLREIVARTVEYYERSLPIPWNLPDSATFLDRLLSQIVGFRIEIESLEGKWKLNQNHPAERRMKVAVALHEQGDENSTAIASLMREERA
jgi:transcriptional regulator